MVEEQVGLSPEPYANIFLSYAHEDNAWRLALQVHLGYLINRGLVHVFSDQELMAGDEWEKNIHAQLKRADVIIPLISGFFLNSKYCSVVELELALEQYTTRGARIVPILVDHCDWEALPFSKFEIRPVTKDKKIRPLIDWDNRNVALREVARDIRLLVEKVSRDRPKTPERSSQKAPPNLEKPSFPAIHSIRRFPLKGSLPCLPSGTVNAKVLFKGVGPGTHASTQDARLTGFTARDPNATPAIMDMIRHIADGSTNSPFISFVRSYSVAYEYALAGRVPPSPKQPGFIYEIDPGGDEELFIIDPVIDLARMLAASSEPYYSGGAKLLCAIVDPFSHSADLVASIPGLAGQGRPMISRELEAMVRVLRDTEVLGVGHIAAKHVINRHAVF